MLSRAEWSAAHTTWELDTTRDKTYDPGPFRVPIAPDEGRSNEELRFMAVRCRRRTPPLIGPVGILQEGEGHTQLIVRDRSSVCLGGFSARCMANQVAEGSCERAFYPVRRRRLGGD